MKKTDPPPRQSCGYLTGIMLHRAHGEKLCALCRARAGDITPDPPPPPQLPPDAHVPHRRRAIIVRDTPTADRIIPAGKGPGKKGDYGFPSIF